VSHWTEKLQKFDRRWIFLAMGVAIVIPLFVPLNLPIRASTMVKSAYYAVEDLQPGAVVLVSLDLDPASTPELEPYYRAVMYQLKHMRAKVVIVTTWYAAPPLVERWIRQTVEAPMGDEGVYKPGEDYLYLGFREGREATINRMASDFPGTYDYHATDGTPLASVPWMKDRKTLADFDLVVLVSAGYPGIKEYVQQAHGRGNVRMVGACTAVSQPDYTPYFNAGQILGLVGGMKRAAEYEQLVGRPGLGFKGTDVLNFGHVVVIFAIVFGNFIYFSGERHKRRRPRGA
jgi:hypothetical protein